MPAPSRDPWLDNTKVLLVTLVVVGHAWSVLADSPSTEWAYDFLYLWHIPAFVFVSGYLSKSFEWDRRRMTGLVHTLLVPYLLFEPALYLYRVEVVGEDVGNTLWLEPHWTMWYLVVLLLWRLATPILRRHWLFLPASVVVSLAGGLWSTDVLMLPRFLGLLPFFVLGLHVKPHHLARLDDVWVRVSAVPALLIMGAMAVYTDEWARTAIFWYDAGYEDVGIDPVIGFQTRLTVMVLGFLGTFSVLALVPRRSLGWFTTMGAATMVVYLFHGFFIKSGKLFGWPEWAADNVAAGFVITTLAGVLLALVLGSPPVRRVLQPLTTPLLTLQHRHAARAAPDEPTRRGGPVG